MPCASWRHPTGTGELGSAGTGEPSALPAGQPCPGRSWWRRAGGQEGGGKLGGEEPKLNDRS